MLTYFIKKFLGMIPMLLIISVLIFFAMELSPIDPISYLATPDMADSAENLEALRESLGLNDPVHVRYARWFVNLFKGDFGYSIATGTPILSLIMMKLPATLELSFVSIIISTIVGIGFGLIASIRPNTVIDYIARFIGVVGISIPQFFFGIVVIQIFAIKMGILPIGGRMSYGDVTFFDRLPKLILPSITMSIAMLAALLRYTRNSMLDVLNKDYIKTASSKGIAEWKVYIKHAFRNSLGPVLVILIFRLPLLIGGSVVIEAIFNWPGIGSIILPAVTSSDYPVIMMTSLMIAAAILLSSFLVDVVAAFLDPRVRLG